MDLVSAIIMAMSKAVPLLSGVAIPLISFPLVIYRWFLKVWVSFSLPLSPILSALQIWVSSTLKVRVSLVIPGDQQLWGTEVNNLHKHRMEVPELWSFEKVVPEGFSLGFCILLLPNKCYTKPSAQTASRQILLYKVCSYLFSCR